MTTYRFEAPIKAALLFTLLQAGAGAVAFELPVSGSDLKLKWDNTVKYSAAFRLRDPSETLTSAAANANNPNLDDGDRNFGKGLISNRLDLLSEFDAAYHAYGLRLSGAAWYDDVYNRKNDNPGPPGASANHVPYDEFPAATRGVHGRGGELLDAFVYGGFNFGEGQRASVRLGRHGMVWGETFFFGANGIAGGMMPVDVVKLVSVPSTQFKEAIRPVPMLSGQVQLTADTAVGAYYQFRWAKSRIPQVGSYFSVADTLPDGAERLLLGPASAPRTADQKPKDSGQGGVQLRSRFDATDVGLYLIRFHDKTPQLVPEIGPAGPQGFHLAYGQSIGSVGASASRTFDAVNLAAELSFRRNQPLTSAGSQDLSAVFGTAPTDNDGNPAYPVGKTAHFNASALWTIDPNALFRESMLIAELGWNRVLSVTRNAALLNPSATRDAYALRALFQTVHRQVVTGFDVMPQFGLGWAPRGSRSAITPTSLPQNNNGDMTLGVEVAYLDTWRANLSMTHYFGSTGSFLTPLNTPGASTLSYKQYYGDRDFIALSLRTSF